MVDLAAEPLIPATALHHHEVDDSVERVTVNVPVALEKDLRRPGIFVCLLTLSAAFSGLLFGYDTGVISSTLVAIKSSLGHPLTTLEKSLITSVTAMFALFIAPFSGLLADTFGRKTVVLVSDVAFVAGALIQALTPTVPGMIVGRGIVGLGVGAGSFVAPLYITELAPAPFRGRLVILNVLFVTFGQVVAYIVGWAFVEWQDTSNSWRWIVGLGAVPAAIQILLMLFMPETPRWLVAKKREQDAKDVLTKVYGAGHDSPLLVNYVLQSIREEVREEEKVQIARMKMRMTKSGTSRKAKISDTWIELFRVKRNRRALNIACLLQGLQQLSGFNSLMYFSATIFTLLGFESPTLASLTVASANFVLTCVALRLVDRIGRRRILLSSIPVMIVSLLFCSLGFHFILLPNPISRLPTDLSSNVATTPPPSRIAPTFILLSITLYVGAYAIGLGTVPWLQSELFPLSVRALGSGLSTGTNWASNFLIGLSFLPLMDLLTPTGTFILYAALCAVGWILIWRFYPETMGCGLEEIGALLDAD
ncbi:Myo-inositol transporter 1 [Podosphaera aphanis]|nr:Myo-inositol transporter 1 [Podosphaera aphanis]